MAEWIKASFVTCRNYQPSGSPCRSPFSSPFFLSDLLYLQNPVLKHLEPQWFSATTLSAVAFASLAIVLSFLGGLKQLIEHPGKRDTAYTHDKYTR